MQENIADFCDEYDASTDKVAVDEFLGPDNSRSDDDVLNFNSDDEDESIDENAEPDIPEDEECEYCSDLAKIAYDGLFYCNDCYETDVLHQGLL